MEPARIVILFRLFALLEYVEENEDFEDDGTEDGGPQNQSQVPSR